MTKGQKTMKKPMLLISSPNCGSDWLATTLCDSQKGINYSREFFNPANNHKYCEILAKGFGCEYITCYQKIADMNQDICEKIFKLTWEKEEYNFTKENYSCMKIPFFVKEFNCFALTRDVRDSLPAKRRTHVTSWYLSIYESLILNKDSLPKKIVKKLELFSKLPTKMDEKVVFCFCLYQELLIMICKHFHIPILDWKLISSLEKSKLIQYLESSHGVIRTFAHLDLESWSDEIIKTKKERSHEFHIMDCDWIIEEFFDKKLITM